MTSQYNTICGLGVFIISGQVFPSVLIIIQYDIVHVAVYFNYVYFCLFILLLLLYIACVYVVIVLHWAEEALVPFGMLHLNKNNNNNNNNMYISSISSRILHDVMFR